MKHLHGKRILLTRTPEQNQDTAKLVTAIGAIPILLPCTQIQPCIKNIQHTLQTLTTCTPIADIIFSSRNGVESLFLAAPDATSLLRSHRIIAVGDQTALALNKHGLSPTWLPQIASQQGLIQAYPKHGLPRHAIFFRAKTGSDALLSFLQQHGCNTTLCHAYDTICHPETPIDILHMLEQGQIDAVLLGSARTAEFYVTKTSGLPLANQPVVAVMSEQVAKAADKLGLKVQVIAHQPSFKAMLEALNYYFEHQK